MTLLLSLLLAGPALADGEAYRVGPGDRLTVRVYDEPDLSGEIEVSEACEIRLALVGSLEVCDRTPAEIAAEVTEAYRGDFLVQPSVTVQVTAYRSQRVDVLGEVEKRGPIYLEGPTTLVEAISLAGGPKADNVVGVEVIDAGGEKVTYDLTQLAAAPDAVLVTSGDKIFLKPGQVVYVEGQIQRPGVVTLSEGLTVTEALALAGGADEQANLRRVLVRRADGSQETVNVQRVHRGREPDPVLGRDDHVVVPRTPF